MNSLAFKQLQSENRRPYLGTGNRDFILFLHCLKGWRYKKLHNPFLSIVKCCFIIINHLHLIVISKEKMSQVDLK
jgi:hypothetical protein